ncbi:T9SS type A sorting domain-containing protein, partial [bacterium]|nr:T9SS type A sorting domain-containing protein [bacterium]
PSPYYPQRFLLPFVDDFDNDSGNVYWEVQGTEPNRRLIIEWYNRVHYSISGGASFEMILSEGSNDIVYQYADVNLNSASYNAGVSATIGIQGDSVAANNNFLQFSHLTASLHDNLAIRFYTYTPQPGDLALQSIDVPAAAYMPAGAPFTPTATVANPGTTPVSDFQVVYQIDDGAKTLVYSDTVFIVTPDTLIAGADTQIAFDTFSPAALTDYTVAAFVVSAGDPFPDNDTARGAFRSYDRDIATTAINVPAGAYVHPDSTIAPAATFHNYGLETSTFDATFRIDSAGVTVYTHTVTVSDLAPGADAPVAFNDWAAPHPLAEYQAVAYAVVDHDLVPANDTMTFLFRTYSRDIGTVINVPAAAYVHPDSTIAPAATFHNYGLETSTFDATFRIDSAGVTVYTHTVTVSDLAPGADAPVAFNDWAAPHPLAEYQAVAYAVVDHDLVPANDTMTFLFRTYSRDIGTVINVPAAAYVHPDSTIAPAATFHNYGLETSTFDASFWIDLGGGTVYTQAATIAGLAPGADTTVVFADWPAPHDLGGYQAYAAAYIDLDLDPANDTAMLAFSTTPAWYYVTDVPNGGGAYTRWSYSGSGVSNGLLWLVAGRRDAGWAVLNNVGTYDPASNTWDDTRPVVNQARVYLTAAGNDQYVFALGGRSSDGATIYANNERLDSPAGSAWTTMTAMPAGRAFGAAVADAQYVYYLGGTSDAGGTTATTTLWRYDIAADTAGGTPWEQALAQIPYAMNSADATLIDGKIYVLGDATNNHTCIYDIAADSWSTIDNGAAGLPAASMYEAVSMYGKVWRIGGILAATNTSTNQVYELDPIAGTWTDIAKPMQQTRISFNSGFINGSVIAAGGVAFPGFTPTMTAEAIDVSWMGVAGKPTAVTAPGTFTVYGNFPNPFRSNTRIEFQLPKAGRVSLAVYSVTGQLVRTIASGEMTAGRHSAGWNGRDNAGRAVSSGVYFYRLSAAGANATGKLVVVR